MTLTVRHEGIGGTKFILSDFNAINKANHVAFVVIPEGFSRLCCADTVEDRYPKSLSQRFIGYCQFLSIPDSCQLTLSRGVSKSGLRHELGSHPTSYYGEEKYPRPSAVIMQYTGYSTVYGNEPATYNCVGTSDGIAPYRTMQNRIDALRSNGTDAVKALWLILDGQYDTVVKGS